MSSNTVPFPDRQPRVSFDEDSAVFHDFVERDPTVVMTLAEASDPEAAAHVIMQIGARAVSVANASADTQIVDKAFHEMTAAFDERLAAAVEDVTAAGDRLFKADEGEVNKSLEKFRQELDGQLGETFDPDSKKSVIGKVEQMLEESAERSRRAMRRLIDPSEDDSPLHKIQRDLTEVMQNNAKSVHQAIDELAERIAIEEAAAEVYEMTTLKGADFETLVHGTLGPIAAAHGDVAEQTGDASGDDGNKKGDIVVTLAAHDTPGFEARIAVECKDRKLNRNQIKAELDAALSNRSAAAAILVFASPDQCPTGAPFCYEGNQATVVLNKDTTDSAALRLAYMWARWQARQHGQPNGDGLDVDTMRQTVEEIAATLGKIRTIKRGHTQARKGIDLADDHLVALQRDVEEHLDTLREALAEGDA